MGGSQGGGLRDQGSRFLYACGVLAIVPALLLGACFGGFETQTQSQSPAPSVLLKPTAATHPPPSHTPSPFPFTATPTPTQRPGPELTIRCLHPDHQYQIPLTVQHLSKDTAYLFFALSGFAEGALFWGPADEYPRLHRRIDLYPPTRSQLAVMENLHPNREYVAQVGIRHESGEWAVPGYFGKPWGPVHFRTPAEDPWPLKVGVLGDSGFGEAATKSLANKLAQRELDLVLHTGDLVYLASQNASPQEAFAEKYFWPLEPLLTQVPVYSVMGNHALDAGLAWQGHPYYETVFPTFSAATFEPADGEWGRRWYTFTYGSVRFLMLDSQVFFGRSGRVEENTWLESHLQETTSDLIIPVFHVPPYTSGLHALDGRPIQAHWVPLFESANIAFVISGHDHNYERLSHKGVTYLVSGGGSTSLYPLSKPLAFSETFHARTHFVQLSIFPDRIEIRAEALDGTVLDEAQIPLPKAGKGGGDNSYFQLIPAPTVD